MISGCVGVAGVQRDTDPLAFRPHRFDDLGDRAVDVQRESFDRPRLDDVAQVVHEPLQRLELALDGGADRQARFLVEVVAHQQARAVAEVLNRMREIVDETGGEAAEHRLALLALDVLLQLDQAIGHQVERVAEIGELVAGPDVDAGGELAGGDGLGAALQRENRRQEPPAEEIADRDHRRAARRRWPRPAAAGAAVALA